MTRKLGLVAVGVLIAVPVWLLTRTPAPTYYPDVARIVRNRCADCHRDGGAAPFPLVDVDDVKKRAALIADVTRRRLMPPWMPEPGCGDFEGDRSLPPAELDLLQRWIAAGMVEGDPNLAPDAGHDPQPRMPDYIAELPEPYVLAADGRDEYRNFVLPLPLPMKRYVHAVEFRPGNPRAVHHAFLYLDRTKESERLDRADAAPGFPGLHVPSTAQAPIGHFLSWQPGRRSPPPPEDMAWTLWPGSSLVIQAHLRPTGKPESIRPSVAFYFTDKTPTRTPAKIGLWTEEIRIPAGQTAVVRDSLTLAADVDLLRILPHAHFLARRVEATAVLPDGSTRCLLRIPAWDFNWQGDYAYRTPIFLPKGTRISMQIDYDNTAANPRNPNQPPKDVAYGIQSGDEMAEVWMQVLPKSADGAGLLEESLQPKVFASGVAYNRYLLRLDPGNARARTELGKALFFQRKFPDAAREFDDALRIRDEAEPHYYLGLLHRMGGRTADAAREFRQAIRLKPDEAKAYGNLGLVLVSTGDVDGAEAALMEALRLNPEDSLARETLAELREAKKKR